MLRYKLLLINVIVLVLASGCATQNVSILDSPTTASMATPAKSKAPLTVEQATVDIAHSFEELQLSYSRRADEMRDCSGVFLRVADELKERFPNVLAPDAEDARSSRDIASWYADQDRLVEVENATLARDLIHPGAVMFYAIRGKKGENPISHVGVVTEVERDSKGHVTDYKLFHARGKGETAAVTGHHGLDNKPALGNGKQHWVAIAQMLPAEAVQGEFLSVNRTAGVKTTGLASWYGGKSMNGRKTASGEKLNKTELTAAHPTLPFGTKVEVTNLKNNKKVTVRVNDRGPFEEGRIIDLSELAAKQIGLKQAGVAKVKIRVVEESKKA